MIWILPSERKQAELTKERQERKGKKITDEAKIIKKKKEIETSEETSRKTDIKEDKTEKTTKVEHTKADNTIKRYDKSQLLQGKIKMGIGRRRKRSVTPGPGIGGKKRRSSSKGGVDYVGGVALQVTSVILSY